MAMEVFARIINARKLFNNTSKRRFIRRYKLNKKINGDKEVLFVLNIFDLLYTFAYILSSYSPLNLDNIAYCDITVNYSISNNSGFVSFKTPTDNITYYPKFNRCEVTNDHICYTVYSKTKISGAVKEDWETLSRGIRIICYEALIYMVDNDIL